MKQRIVYVDNLKALAIFTVVFGHVFWFSWGHYGDNIWCYLISSFNMPLFFFLSGMFAKDNMNLRHLGRKARQLLIPTLVVGGIYTYIKGCFSQLFFGPLNYGYWFLPTLFVMFTLFYIRCLTMKYLRMRFHFSEMQAIVIDVFFMLGAWGGAKVVHRFVSEDIYNLFCLGGIANYIMFFWVGFLAWKYKATLTPWLHKHSDWIYAISFLCFGSLFYFIHYSGYEIHGIFYREMVKVMALFAIPLLMMFFKKVDLGQGNCQSVVSFIGTHSLEIYVLQYFFLPTEYQLGNSVMGGVNSLFLSFAESVLTIAMCVVVIKIIGYNKYLNLIFFGK